MVLEQGGIKKFKSYANNTTYPLSSIKQNNNNRGLEGKQKGLLQVRWERGIIHINNLGVYTVDGKKDAFRVIQKETSLKHLISNYTDFKEEESLLQAMFRQMGVAIDCTP